MKYDFNRIISRENTASRKWDDAIDSDGNKLLPFWVADIDFKAPNEVIEALKERIEHGIFGYTGISEGLTASVNDWILKKHQWKTEKEWVCYTPGIVLAIDFAIEVFTKKGDKVLTHAPIYPPFIGVPTYSGREVVESELKLVDGKYEIDFDDFEKKSKECKLFILSNPHNPGGRVFTKEELLKMGEICLKNNILIISDEIHSDIVYKGYKHIPMASLSKELENNTISCYSASKTFSLAGFATSAVIIPNEKIRQEYENYLFDKHIPVNALGKVALEAAYKYGEDYLEQLLVYLEGNRDYLVDYFKNNMPKIKPIMPESTYLLWLDCRELGLNDDELNEFFFSCGVMLSRGKDFSSKGRGFMRFNFGCPRTTLEQGLTKIKNGYDKKFM